MNLLTRGALPASRALPPAAREKRGAPPASRVPSPTPRATPRSLLALLTGLCGLGCTDLDRFSTSSNEAYCGSITLGGSFRTGLSPRVQMRLTLDAPAIDGAASPGAISTFEASTDMLPERRLLLDAELRRIPALENDALSRPDLGSTTVRSALFAVTPVDPAAESILTVVSLRTDDGVDVRLLRPGVALVPGEPPKDARRPLFGIFPLTKQVGSCGF